MAFGPAAMGYDRAITIFSPDGSLYQVDYAFEAVKKGWTTLGVKTKAGVVLIGEKRKATQLLDVDSIEKVFILDDHVGCSFAGLASDGRILIDYARSQALQHRLIYDEPINIDYLTKLVSDVKQMYTQHGGVRPFGVALIIGGIDRGKTPKLLMTEPSGQFMPYYAVAIGQGGYTATEYFEKNYREDLNMQDTILLGIRALASTLKPGEKLAPSNIEVGFADVDSGMFRKMSFEERASILQKL
ncbi:MULTISPECIES: archaeal proteasome endopeptidase complex subunit alpha [Sulfurisphaera]|uniref:Proteasome subunit alpha n=3 Tax=Sulfurisphaera TaxID=69655 RepID=PSA_SULTO|nr:MULTISPECIES: archaeal proteasome endopeptidase complex subunit alpha [Sulfurisphaera]Q975G5.2 RecName: Full=Proteasome subunit alpha; AltName: Full=20S proteasome alpha subunit; AltName: Full=Proteasome core protein PsmA [Sulfurisphaera tokodaii str. 7]MBB5252973.1 proteasome alpha subunit [Sulfurisphaera ohwakuensis]QGR16100.1 archaeal proteasome endopeptidase complex subunit alpha [Sulfurisphaera ohwakuensis]HII74865.1 archaeal proteasome endopeptidase complex subunit alpha [Sulfurisphaer